MTSQNELDPYNLNKDIVKKMTATRAVLNQAV